MWDQDELRSEISEMFSELQSFDRREGGFRFESVDRELSVVRRCVDVSRRIEDRAGRLCEVAVEAKCASCGGPFRDSHPNARYCSPACSFRSFDAMRKAWDWNYYVNKRRPARRGQIVSGFGRIKAVRELRDAPAPGRGRNNGRGQN